MDWRIQFDAHAIHLHRRHGLKDRTAVGAAGHSHAVFCAVVHDAGSILGLHKKIPQAGDLCGVEG